MVSPDYITHEEEELYDFSTALDDLKKGKTIYRKWWNWKNMYLQLQKPDKFSKMTLPYIYMVIPNQDNNIKEKNSLVPWLASQTDLLAMDWKIID